MTEPLLDLKNKVALVTGAGQGIGRAIALSLATHHAGVIIVNDFHLDRAEVVATEIRGLGSTAFAAAGNVADADQVAEMVESATDRFGTITILVNNAGNAGPVNAAMAPSPPFWESKPEEWDRWFEANLFGVMHCCRAVLPGMIARGEGRILTIGSDAGRVGEAGMEAYSAAKAGAAGFLRALARSVGRHDITVNTISLGAMRTSASEASYADPEFLRRVLRGYVIRRLGEPEDAAAMALFLVSDAARWITGQTIAVNGGYSFSL